MNKKILNIFSILSVMAFLMFISLNVSAERFDVTDISYSYVSNNYPYYPNAQYYNNYNGYYGNYYNYYDNYYPTGYVNAYTGYINSYPAYNNYYPTYYTSYPSYYNTISYGSPEAYVSFSWQWFKLYNKIYVEVNILWTIDIFLCF